MRRTLIAATCMVILALAGQAHAKIINGQYIPDSLASGAKYRLIFVTSGTTTGTSGIAATYDAFALGQANAPNSLLGGGFDYGWQAVMSTYGTNGTDGRVAADVISGGAAIYNTRGILVGDNGADMLDGNLDNAIQYDQHGTPVVAAYAWTGSLSNGQAYHTAFHDLRVGAPPATPGQGPNGDYTLIGDPSSTSGSWLQYSAILDQQGVGVFPGINPDMPDVNAVARVYAISGELTAVPEPATLVMWSLFAGVAGLVFWRKGSKSN